MIKTPQKAYQKANNLTRENSKMAEEDDKAS